MRIFYLFLVFFVEKFGVSIGNDQSCSIPPIPNQNEIKLVPDQEECNKINNDYKVNSNYNFIDYFGNMFDTLMKGIDSLNIPNKNTKMNVIFFVGNTGSGKSTSMLILTGNNTKIFSKPVRDGSDEYIIVDYNKIGTDTITSETLYPDIVIDNESGYVFCDNPGFRDTRSPIHEIVSMYSMRKVLKYTDKIKIVLVTTRASLKVGMYRDDFINSLKHLTEFIHDVPKYADSLFLLGTKVENAYVKRNGKPEIVSDDMVVADIGYYLNEVKNSLNSKTNFSNVTENKKDFYDKSIKIIEKYLEKSGDKYWRIKIIRRPDDVGPLSEIESLQEERRNIRNTLVTDKNFVSVNYNDFGLPLSDSSLLFLNDLFVKMNSYITDLSKLISFYLSNRYESYLNLNYDIINIIQQLLKIKSNTRSFSNEIGEAKNPGKFVDIAKTFSDVNNLKMDCLASFKNISKMNEFLSSLDDLTDSSKYNPLSWNMTMKIVNDYLERKLEEYSFLKDIFDLLSGYKSQQHRNLYNVRNIQHWGINNQEQGLEINTNNFKNFIEKVNLNNRYSLITTDAQLIKRVNSILKLALQHGPKVNCKNDTLTIVDYFIVTSELEGKYPQMCANAKRIEIYALHSLFIDRDIAGDWFNGKHITIIAPIWTVIGTRRISVEGRFGGGQMAKAAVGQIGQNGISGRPGGKFVGIGQIFNNGENLAVSVKGGDGQNGQDGGDGLNGKDGAHGNQNNRGGEPGGVGGDSGAGGSGGFGGKKGQSSMFNLGREDHRITFETGEGRKGIDGRNGVPGRGGTKGCDLHVEKHSERFLGIKIGSSYSSYFVNCGIKNRDGNLLNRVSDPIPFDYEKIQVTPICTHLLNFKKYFTDNYQSVLSDGTAVTFINRMISAKY